MMSSRSEKDVLAAALRDHVPGRVERDSLGVAVLIRLHQDQLRIHVVRSDLGNGRKGVRGDPRPGGNADINACSQRL